MPKDAKYEQLVKSGREAARSQWTLGDNALEVETVYGENSLGQYADDVGVELRTLEDYKWVASKYDSTVRTVLSFAVHKVFASQEDRLELIGKKKWTARQARDFVQHRGEDDQTDEELDEKMAAFEGYRKIILETADAYYDEDRKEEFYQRLAEFGQETIDMVKEPEE